MSHGTTGTLTPHGVATATSPTAHSAPLGNICNTLPHAPSSSGGGGGGNGGLSSSMASNLPLNRNLVMLRNHLRKNTGSITGNGGVAASGVGAQLLQDQDDRLEDQ
uniref:GG11115 n=1 Tax=Drosophila erecta TaxID=7220 RepID=B3P7M2_DROER